MARSTICTVCTFGKRCSVCENAERIDENMRISEKADNICLNQIKKLDKRLDTLEGGASKLISASIVASQINAVLDHLRKDEHIGSRCASAIEGLKTILVNLEGREIVASSAAYAVKGARRRVLEHLDAQLGTYRDGDIQPDHLIKQIAKNLEALLGGAQ